MTNIYHTMRVKLAYMQKYTNKYFHPMQSNVQERIRIIVN